MKYIFLWTSFLMHYLQTSSKLIFIYIYIYIANNSCCGSKGDGNPAMSGTDPKAGSGSRGAPGAAGGGGGGGPPGGSGGGGGKAWAPKGTPSGPSSSSTGGGPGGGASGNVKDNGPLPPTSTYQRDADKPEKMVPAGSNTSHAWRGWAPVTREWDTHEQKKGDRTRIEIQDEWDDDGNLTRTTIKHIITPDWKKKKERTVEQIPAEEAWKYRKEMADREMAESEKK